MIDQRVKSLAARAPQLLARILPLVTGGKPFYDGPQISIRGPGIRPVGEHPQVGPVGRSMTVLQMPEPHRDLASEIEALPGLLTASELAPRIGISLTTIYQMVTEKRIPYLRIGSMIRFDPRAIAAWLREHTVVAAA